ncbi:MAG: cyclase family protein [Chitinophagaceae bacterium]|nr:MAG: cyclase family protein [Chitinophagaceae bacterium]
MKLSWYNSEKKCYQADLMKPLDISIPLVVNADGPKAWGAPPFYAEPWKSEDGKFVGAVSEGAPVNFFNVQINPHGNGTHTECVGHITDRPFTINQCLRRFWFPALLISLTPEETENKDRVLLKNQIENAAANYQDAEALIIRTLPNTPNKKIYDYTGENPAYFDVKALQWMATETNIKHLLTDLPSVDRESDGGKLAGHKAFWQYPHQIREDATITEMIYVPESIPDGLYLLNIQIVSFELDVSPSKPILYALEEESS